MLTALCRPENAAAYTRCVNDLRTAQLPEATIEAALRTMAKSLTSLAVEEQGLVVTGRLQLELLKDLGVSTHGVYTTTGLPWLAVSTGAIGVQVVIVDACADGGAWLSVTATTADGDTSLTRRVRLPDTDRLRPIVESTIATVEGL